MATSPDLELRLGSLSIEEDEGPEESKVSPERGGESKEKEGIDLNREPAVTPNKEVQSQEVKVGLVYSEQMLLHAHPKGDHPEQPARISSIYRELKRQRLVER